MVTLRMVMLFVGSNHFLSSGNVSDRFFFCFSYRERSSSVVNYIIKTHFCGSVWSLKSLLVTVNVFYIFFCDK